MTLKDFENGHAWYHRKRNFFRNITFDLRNARQELKIWQFKRLLKELFGY